VNHRGHGETQRKLEIHPALARALRRRRRLGNFFASLEESWRQQFDSYIREAKREETRKRRVLRVIEHLTETMEAELDLPPLLRRALAGNPRARQGWDLMPQALRRHHLLTIFRSRYPETRAAWVEMVAGECARYADRHASELPDLSERIG